MRIAPYHRSYMRKQRDGGTHAEGYVSNPASHMTDKGADANPGDLGWCIRHEWRVIYYTYRYAAGLPLWEGVDDFEILMADVLFRLSSGFQPIAPIHSAPIDKPERDTRKDRVYQSSCRIYPTPVIEEPEGTD